MDPQQTIGMSKPCVSHWLECHLGTLHMKQETPENKTKNYFSPCLQHNEFRVILKPGPHPSNFCVERACQLHFGQVSGKSIKTST